MPKPDVPYLVVTDRGPQIAEWRDGQWLQWLSGDLYDIGIRGEVEWYCEISSIDRD